MTPDEYENAAKRRHLKGEALGCLLYPALAFLIIAVGCLVRLEALRWVISV